MKKLCVFTLYDIKGASSQYRAYLYKEEMEKHFDVQWFPFWSNKYIEKYMHNKRKYFFLIGIEYFISFLMRLVQLYLIAPKCDVIFIQKCSIPEIKNSFLCRAKKNGVRIVLDVDDAVYLNKRDSTDKIAKIADVVICGNTMLKTHYEQFNKNCVVLPTVENTRLFEPFWKNTYDEKVICWIGSLSTIDNLELVMEPINEVIKRHPEVSFRIISNNDHGYAGKIKNASLIEWDRNTYIAELSKCSVGIMPLKNSEFNKCKCGFKLIQYLNMKKPVIGSPVGINSDIINLNGLVAKTETDWIQALEQLLFDEDCYKKCVEHIEHDFFNRYNFDIIKDKLINILKGI